MDVKSIIVREYLESLTEDNELDYIFPLFLESQGFIILSKPTESKGFPQYGKDVVAIGNDFSDGLKKRFYFELKGGNDRHITTTTFTKTDGIKESLYEAKYRKFECSNKEYEKLSLKVVLVHNGEVKANVRDTFEGFIRHEFPETETIEFERWGLSELIILFSEKFFGAFLLSNKETTKHFNKTLINLDVEENVSSSFIKLLNLIFSNLEQTEYKKALPRKWKMFFESLRLISFIIYTESKKEYNNLDIPKRYLTHLVLRFWHWILKNKLEQDKNITTYFNKVFTFYLDVIREYFQRTLPIAQMQDGLFSEIGGKYEQVGYTFRTFEYLQFLCLYLRLIVHKENVVEVRNIIITVLNSNNVSVRPLLDIHSTPIIDILLFLINTEDTESARNYLSQILFYIKLGKEKYDRLPDANNSERNIIKFITTKVKPISYSDSTSPLLAVLMEFIAILEMKDEYYIMRDFINKYKIDLGIFIPHHGINSTSKDFIEDKDNDLEEQLFSKAFFNDGYQRDTNLHKDFDKDLSFEEFKEILIARKDEFIYEYRTNNARYEFLNDLAHIYFRTPYFPDKWGMLLK